MLHGTRVGEEAGTRNLAFFRVKWLQPAMKGSSCVRRVRIVSTRNRFFNGAMQRVDADIAL